MLPLNLPSHILLLEKWRFRLLLSLLQTICDKYYKHYHNRGINLDFFAHAKRSRQTIMFNLSTQYTSLTQHIWFIIESKDEIICEETPGHTHTSSPFQNVIDFKAAHKPVNTYIHTCGIKTTIRKVGVIVFMCIFFFSG